MAKNQPVLVKQSMAGRIKRSLRQDFGSWILLVPTLLMFIVVLWQPLISGVVLSLSLIHIL